VLERGMGVRTWGQMGMEKRMKNSKSENVQERAVFYVYVYFESNQDRQM